MRASLRGKMPVWGEEKTMMNEITLVEIDMKYAEAVWAFRDEVIRADADSEDLLAGCMSLESCTSAEEWIRLCRLRRHAETCRQGGVQVPSTTYLALRKSDGRLVGIIDLRHHIDHPVLSTWGGHSGYSVRPSERGKGYATRMLALVLEKARERGIDRLLITCDEQNKRSERVIVKNGGIYEKTLEANGTGIKRYWITLRD